MKIIDKLNQKGIHISFEVFPPKTDAGFDKVLSATDEIAKLNPSYISVTYGAGGGTSKNTAKIASHIKDDLGVMSLAHLTCASSTKEEVGEVIENLKAHGIENILALRGDIPEGMTFPDGDRFHYAYELVQEIKKHGDFCIGAACYPEGHVEQEHKEDDIRYLKQKVDSGVDFLTILDRFGSSPEAMKQAGIAYATDQIIDLLANGVNNIHIYSMNKPEIAIAIMNNLSEIIKC